MERRVELYVEDTELLPRLRGFLKTTFEPLLDQMVVGVLSWESILSEVEPGLRPALSDFYAACLRHNLPGNQP